MGIVHSGLKLYDSAGNDTLVGLGVHILPDLTGRTQASLKWLWYMVAQPEAYLRSRALAEFSAYEHEKLSSIHPLLDPMRARQNRRKVSFLY